VSGYRRPGMSDYGAQFGLGPGVFTLLVLNVGIFLVEFVLRATMGRDPLFELGAYHTGLAIQMGQIWRFVTYMFLHGSFFHLFFNMLGLWLFGSRLEAIWGTRTFTWYYLVSGVGGGLLYGIMSLAGAQADAPMVGASGAIYGILLAFGLAFPDAIIFVFFFPMRARIAVIVFGVMALMGFGGAHIAHMAHLGGMVTGFLFLWVFTGGRISQPPRLPGGNRRSTRQSYSGSRGAPGGYTGSGYGRSPSLLTRLRNSFHRWRTRMRLTVLDSKRDEDGEDRATRPGNGSPTSRRDAERVDEILEKISKQGLQSLTPEEQDILRRASRKQ
jgi:membrane associated rhomboid family serine protease